MTNDIFATATSIDDLVKRATRADKMLLFGMLAMVFSESTGDPKLDELGRSIEWGPVLPSESVRDCMFRLGMVVKLGERVAIRPDLVRRLVELLARGEIH